VLIFNLKFQFKTFSRKFLETATITNFCCILPHLPHLPENCKFICVSVCSTFLVIIAKERFLSTFFCLESLISKCLFWALWIFEWKQLFSLRETRVFPKTTSQWCRRWAWPISKVALLSYGSADIFADSICSRVMVIHTTIVAFVGLKGLL